MLAGSAGDRGDNGGGPVVWLRAGAKHVCCLGKCGVVFWDRIVKCRGTGGMGGI